MKLNQRQLRRSREGGFSLAELMVVIVIIGLLGSVVVPNLMAKFGKAQAATARTDLRAISSAILEYQMDNLRPPESLEDLVTKDDKGTRYLDRGTVPKDPWGNEYVYEVNSDGDPEVWCYGKDGERGGEGEDEDFSSLTIKEE